MKLLVLGATGRTGRRVVEQARERGHDATALVRDPARAPAGVRVLTGDAGDGGAVAAAVGGQDAVVSTLGPARGSDPGTLTGAIRHLLWAMDDQGVRRLGVVLGAGVEVPEDRQGLGGRAAARLVRLLNRRDLEEKERQLALLRDSDLDWVAVRPPRVVDGPPTGGYRTGLFPTTLRDRITTGDLADFLLDQAETPTFARQAPLIAADGEPRARGTLPIAAAAALATTCLIARRRAEHRPGQRRTSRRRAARRVDRSRRGVRRSR